MPGRALLAAALIAQAPAGTSQASYDVFSTVLASDQRAQLARDARCSDAKRATDIFADLRDPHDGLTALLALERCAVLPRVGNWDGFRDYVMTAAGAVAYAVGVEASEPKAFQRALYDLATVSGYRTPSSRTIVVVVSNPGETRASSRIPNESAGQRAMEAGLPMQNSKTRTHESAHTVGYSGPYGEFATQIGDAAQSALEALRHAAEAAPTTK